ncbi:hypothetical protein PF010_g11878 [Phytophthora fragariae]|uniref:RxLR effector protein n=1 Tax=Phytophthora fragariae TaxID=53985 RepID=A0A6G0RRN2_9STRA|nr:hypothetical protein PF010_g11878 [Phytophthora fragariae]KAE9230121.1 hypothetical protein PF004_g10578 [Phytophthora fragariae]KAE9339947.1 hypothetical protein PF008_g11329 [Phytophthora fragariae]
MLGTGRNLLLVCTATFCWCRVALAKRLETSNSMRNGDNSEVNAVCEGLSGRDPPG